MNKYGLNAVYKIKNVTNPSSLCILLRVFMSIHKRRRVVMFGESLEQTKGQSDSINIDEKELDNILRILTMLEKALDRLLRQNYHNRHQYPPLVLELENTFNNLRSWIQDYKIFCCLKGFDLILGLVMKDLGEIIKRLITESKSVAGKKATKKNKKIKHRENFAAKLTACWNISPNI